MFNTLALRIEDVKAWLCSSGEALLFENAGQKSEAIWTTLTCYWDVSLRLQAFYSVSLYLFASLFVLAFDDVPVSHRHPAARRGNQSIFEY